MSMGRLVIRKCAHGDCEDGGDYRTVDIDIDRPPERLYVHTIPLYGCMDKRSRYTGGNTHFLGTVHNCTEKSRTKFSNYSGMICSCKPISKLESP